MSEEEFWQCSPREFVARRKAWEAEQERLDYRAALIASAAANAYWFQKSDKQPYTPDDFMPKRRAHIQLKGEKDVEEFAIRLALSMGAELPEGGESLCQRLKN